MKNKPEQQREKTREEEIRERADFILGRLGLTMEDLRGKDVLDIGTGTEAKLILAAKEEGIDIIGIDAQKEEEAVQGAQYVYGDFDNVPLEDESFDLILSHAAPPLFAVHSKEDVRKKIEKAKRLLRQGGEFRFGPIGLTAEVFTDRELFTEEEEEIFTTEQRVQRVQERGFEFLQSIDPTIKEDRSAPDGFYALEK